MYPYNGYYNPMDANGDGMTDANYNRPPDDWYSMNGGSMSMDQMDWNHSMAERGESFLLFSPASPLFRVFLGMEDGFYKYRVAYFIHTVVRPVRKRRDRQQPDIIIANLIVKRRPVEFCEGCFNIINESSAQLITLSLLVIEIDSFLDILV